VDNAYNGINDVWGFPCFAPQGCSVKAGTRICQFRIMPSMKAGFWVKLKWLLCGKIRFVEEEYLGRNHVSRGGFGSTGD
jgi:dUTPase